MDVVSINCSAAKGTAKQPVPTGLVTMEGLSGDAHAGPWHRQVSLLGTPVIDRFARELGRPIEPGEFGENATIRDLDASAVGLLDVLALGSVELEVTQIGKECHGEGCAIFQAAGRCVMPVDGIFTRVRQGGEIRAGDPVVHRPRPLVVQIVTLSDRAYAGRYSDESGPLLRRGLEAALREGRFHPRVTATVLPDDPERLRATLDLARDQGADLIVTTGGTGIGPRDFTPEVVTAFCDRLIPGVMELVRMRSADRQPLAALSRSVAGAAGRCLVFALPGSPRAVGDYLEVMVPLLGHMILTVHGVGH